MNESTLVIAFIAFVFLLLIVAVVLRKISVRDVLDNPLSPQLGSRPAQKGAFSTPKRERNFKGIPSRENKTSNFDKETMYKITRAISIIGIIMLMAPLPDGFKVVGFIATFLGSAISKSIAPNKKKGKASKPNTTAQKIRSLAGRPEYQEALKLLNQDYRANPRASKDELYKRAIYHLERKGIAKEEAEKNLMLLFALLNRQKGKIRL